MGYYDMITSATYNNGYDISIVAYEDNGLYKISAYENSIQKKLSNQQKLKRNAVKYRNANAIELTVAYEVNGTRYMYCLCTGKEFNLYNSCLKEKILPFFIREEQTESFKAKKAEKSLSISMSRSKRKIYDYAMANQWEYFVTYTFNDDLMVKDATDYDECVKRLSYYLNNLRKIFPDLVYLVVPEQHVKNKYYNGRIVYPSDPDYNKGRYRWHFHGLMSGIPQSMMVKAMNPKTHKPLVKKGKQIYTISNYNAQNYGYSSISLVEDTKAVSNYICKYITKAVVELSKGKKRYWVSKNAKKGELTQKYDKELKLALQDYFNNDTDYYKEQSIDVDSYHQNIAYIMTAKKHIIQKIKCFDVEDYNRIKALEKQRCCPYLRSLDLVKKSECMKMYMRGTMVEVLVGPFYTEIDYLISEGGRLTAPPHVLETVKIKRKDYTYLSYDSKEYLELSALLDYSNT